MTRYLTTTGMRYKTFEDGVNIAVEYERLGTTIRNIKSYQINYNGETISINCNPLIHEGSKRIELSGKTIFIDVRIRQMMEELESEILDDMEELQRDILNNMEELEIDILSCIEEPVSTVTFQTPPIYQLPEKPTTKRKPTRWELLELD